MMYARTQAVHSIKTDNARKNDPCNRSSVAWAPQRRPPGNVSTARTGFAGLHWRL